MHENRVESLIIWQSRLLILSMYIFVPMHQFQKEIQLINRKKKLQRYSSAVVTPENKTHVSCLKQPIPIANAHDGALPVCLWPA